MQTVKGLRGWMVALCALLLMASGNAWALKSKAHSTKSSLKSERAAKSTSKSIHKSRRTPAVKVVPRRPSIGEARGLHATEDPLDLKSSVALVVDQDTNQVLFSKNPLAVLPIASITKLMTAMVITHRQLPMDEVITVTDEDVDTEKGSRSRLKVGTRLTRGEMLHLALMSSENRAAHALGRSYPGGLQTFVTEMNATAQRLGMSAVRFVQQQFGLAEALAGLQDVDHLLTALR